MPQQPRSDAYEPYLNDYVTEPRIATHYDSDYIGNALFQTDTRLLQQVMDTHAQAGRVLDVGCGTGRHSVYMAERGWQVTALDLSKPMLDELSTKVGDLPIDPMLGDIRDLSKQSEPYQMAIAMFSVLGLIGPSGERDRALRAIGENLASGGDLVFHVHNLWRSWRMPAARPWFWGSLWDHIKGESQWGDKYVANYRGIDHLYIHVFRQGEIRRWLKRCGFRLHHVWHLNEARDDVLSGWAKPWRSNGCVVWAKRR